MEVPVDWLKEPGTALTRLSEAFDGEHQRLFSFLLSVDHELVNARATVTGPRPEVASVSLEPSTGDPSPTSSSQVYVGGASVEADVFDRGTLRAGDVVVGPAIVTEMDSTTLVLPDHVATVHASGSLLITPVGHTQKES